MFRQVINDFASWYEEPRRKLLYVKGALGVGKTWAIKDFATGFFASFVYINLCDNPDICSLLTLNNLDKDLVKKIQSNDFPLDLPDIKPILDAQVTLVDKLLSERYPDTDFEKAMLIFDDAESFSISDCLMHNFKKLHPGYSISVVASTMEITPYQYHYKDIFEIIRMRPMSFEEYLIAQKAHPLIAAINNNKSVPLNPFEEKAILNYLRDYLLIGGMPGIVNEYIKTKNYSRIRSMQNEIIKKYETIIYKKLSSSMSQRCRRIWKSIPSQLERDNKKFMYKYTEQNARAREYSEATQVLCNLGFARKLPRLTAAILPLEEHADYKSFELFLVDHGLLRAMYNLPISEELAVADILQEKNGAIAEQYCFQELSGKLGYLYYWISGATARVPFVYESDHSAIPVDIQLVPRTKAQNVKVFAKKNEGIDISLKISLEQVALKKDVLNVPAYSLWTLI